jgi:hypothetical protein
MITNVIKSAARLSLAPARLAGRVAGSLLREVRGNGTGDADPAPSSARAKPAARTRENTQRKRDGAVARTKAQPKRPATRTRASARPKPLDDVTIARKVETTIFRDIDVDKGKVDVNVAERVVWLRGEVASQDLIKELEARATEVTEVRRVENLLHVPEAPAPGRTDTAAVRAEAEGSSSPRPEPPAVVAAEPSEEASPPESGIRTQPATNGDAAGPAESEVADVDQDAPDDESPEQGPGVVGLGKDSAYQSSGTGQRGPGGD